MWRNSGLGRSTWLALAASSTGITTQYAAARPGAVAGRRPIHYSDRFAPSGTTSLRTNEGASLVASAALLARLVVSGQLYVGAHAGRGRRLEQQRTPMITVIPTGTSASAASLSYVYELPLFRLLARNLRAGWRKLADQRQSRRYRAGSLSTCRYRPTRPTPAPRTYRPNRLARRRRTAETDTWTGVHRRRGFRDAGAVHLRRRRRNLLHGPHLFDSDISYSRISGRGESLGPISVPRYLICLTRRSSAIRARCLEPRHSGTSLGRRSTTVTFSSAPVRHPPQSGWLDEWDRLKGVTC